MQMVLDHDKAFFFKILNLTGLSFIKKEKQLTIFIGKPDWKPNNYNYKPTTKQQPVRLGHQPEHTQLWLVGLEH